MPYFSLKEGIYFDATVNSQAEGIFRINPENGQEEHVREQLNKGTVPEDIDVHCLAGLIKVSMCSLFVRNDLVSLQEFFLP